jgi:hypothetical protein
LFSVIIIILYNKKSVSFSLLYFCLFGCKFEVWRKKTPHSFSGRVFLHYYKFYFFLFFTLYLVSSFL